MKLTADIRKRIATGKTVLGTVSDCSFEAL